MMVKIAFKNLERSKKSVYLQHNKSVSRSATLKNEIGIQPPNLNTFSFYPQKETDIKPRDVLIVTRVCFHFSMIRDNVVPNSSY